MYLKNNINKSKYFSLVFSKYLIFNWKNYALPCDTKTYINKLIDSWKDFNTQYKIFIAVNPLDIKETQNYIKSLNISHLPLKVLAQDFIHEDNKTITSSVSINQLKSLDIEGSIIGHSECRQYLHHTDELINKKLLLALNNKFKVVLCLGESLEIFKSNQGTKYILDQLIRSLLNVNNDLINAEEPNLFIAYEPIWSIGTGIIPKTNNIHEISKAIKEKLIELLPINGISIPILYGGSVNPENALDFLSIPTIDGVLVGKSGVNPDNVVKMMSLKNKI